MLTSVGQVQVKCVTCYCVFHISAVYHLQQRCSLGKTLMLEHKSMQRLLLSLRSYVWKSCKKLSVWQCCVHVNRNIFLTNLNMIILLLLVESEPPGCRIIKITHLIFTIPGQAESDRKHTVSNKKPVSIINQKLCCPWNCYYKKQVCGLVKSFSVCIRRIRMLRKRVEIVLMAVPRF